MRKMVKEIVESVLVDSLPTKIKNFSDWCQDILASIPEAYREDVNIKFRSEKGYEESDCVIIATIFYLRRETDKEYNRRVIKENLDAKREEASERAELTRLLTKYMPHIKEEGI